MTAAVGTRLATMGVAAALTVALAGGPAAAAKPKNACRLLKTREVGEILGEDVGKGKLVRAPGEATKSCFWLAKKAGTGGIDGVPLQLEVAVGSGSAAVADYEDAADQDDATPVDDLGDNAFSSGNELFVLDGNTVVRVALHGFSSPDPLSSGEIAAIEQEAAELVVKRLR